jgi:ribosomal protein S18 acetylase RimI-like enzyme
MATDVDEIQFRLARSSDVQAIAALHADSWRHAYRGMLPDAYLDHEVFADRAAVWQERLSDADEQPVTVTILAERNGELLGFAHSFIDEDPEWGTLLDNLHVRHGTKRSGIGRRLMAETAAWLEERGHTSGLYLWVLKENVPARRFYDALGGRVAGSGVSHLAGGSAPKLRYWWPQLAELSSHLPQPRRPLA